MATDSIFQPDWSTLPTCLLTSIAELLPTQLDIRRFRAVCRSFRQSVTLTPKARFPYPNLEIPGSAVSDTDPEDVLILKQSKFYAIEPLKNDLKSRKNTETWILRVEELNDMGSGLVSMKTPFCGKPYPIVSNKLSKSVNLLDYRVKVMGNSIYKLNFDFEDYICDKEHEFRKVVVSDDGSAVMALLYDGGLAVWRNGDKDWTNIDDFIFSRGDIIYHKEKFYAVCDRTLLITVDPVSLNFTKIGSYKMPSGYSKYLVKFSTDLFLFVKYYEHSYESDCDDDLSDSDVDRFENYILKFRVLKFDEEKNEFVLSVNAFRKEVLFVGHDFAFSVPGKEFPGLRKNCVYLRDDIFYNLNKGYKNLDKDDDLSLDEDDNTSIDDDEDEDVFVHEGLRIGVYDLGRNTAWPLSAFSNTTLWPPPSWL